MVSVSANVKLSPGGILFLTLIGVVLLLYVRQKFPISQITFPTDILTGSNTGDDFKTEEARNISLKRLIAASLYVAELGGRKLMEIRKSKTLEIKSKGKTLEGANDPVTEGDMSSHYIMFGLLKKHWPGLHIVSEEKGTRSDENIKNGSQDIDFHYLSSILKKYKDEIVPSEQVTVWIDPLDATNEYTENLMKYVTTMVCIAVNGSPVAGIIHQPLTGLSHWAWVNHGHSNFDHKEQYSSKTRIIVSRSHAGSVNKTASKLLKEPFSVTSAGGAGYKALAVALGNADLYAHVTAIKKWDICAGNAIINAIGGNMTDMHGKTIDYSPFYKIKLQSGLLASLKNHAKFVSYFKGLKL